MHACKCVVVCVRSVRSELTQYAAVKPAIPEER